MLVFVAPPFSSSLSVRCPPRLTAPCCEPPTRDDVIESYGAIGDAVDMPLIAYNLPAVTGIDLDLEFYRDLAQRSDKYRFVKDTSGNMEQAMSLI